ncbi:MAG: DsbA family protein [Acidimicrobiia bacterium]
MVRSFAITYDYLCPFACVANDVVVEALQTGAEWDVRFMPFSLAQSHVDDGEPAVWNRPAGAEGTRGVTAHQWALAVRQAEPERFLDFHLALFGARHRLGRDVDDGTVLTEVASSVGVDPAAVAGTVASGDPMAMLSEEHTEAVKRWSVFGVPTFIAGDGAVFVRLMKRSRADVERVLDMLDWSNLNEFKRTSIPR